MSILTFSDSFLKKFGDIVYPELHVRYTKYSRWFKTKTSDKEYTNINKWLLEGTTEGKEVLLAILEQQDLIGSSHDDTMRNILLWVNKNVKYVPDTTVHKLLDYWQTPLETLQLRTGDCEDGATLILALAYTAKIPSDRYWLQWGEVIGGGHAYVCYLRESDVEEVVLDWCYWFTPLVIKLRGWLGDDERYGKIWGTASYTGE